MPGLDPNQIVFVLSLLYSEPIILRHNPLINTYHGVTSSEPELVVSVSIFFPVFLLICPHIFPTKIPEGPYLLHNLLPSSLYYTGR